MNKALSFAKLDLYTIKPYCKTLLILLAVSIVMMVAFKSVSTMVFYLMMCLMLVSSYPFTIGEKNGMDTLYATLSLKRRDVVIGRYIFVACLAAACVLLVLVIASFALLLGILEFSLQQTLLSLCASSVVLSFLVAVQYPFYFRLGYTKAKWIAFAPFVIVIAGVMLISNAGEKIGFTAVNFEDILKMVTENPLPLCAACIIAGLLLLCLSCAISCRLYAAKEF